MKDDGAEFGVDQDTLAIQRYLKRSKRVVGEGKPFLRFVPSSPYSFSLNTAQAVKLAFKTALRHVQLVVSAIRPRPRRLSSFSPPHAYLERLAAYYARNQPGRPQDYVEQVQQELKWLEQAARASSDNGGASWQDRLERMVEELVELDKPLAYILGTQPFHPLPIELLVRPPSLIPRPETEHWVSLLTGRFLASNAFSRSASTRPFRILDIGTGTGCIALGLTYGLSQAGRRAVQTLAVDRSDSALSLVRENAERCSLLPFSSSSASSSFVSLLQADVFSPAFPSAALSALNHSSPHPHSPGPRQPFDLVVSNPPYIPLSDYAQLERSVRDWEDRGALVGEVPSSSSSLAADAFPTAGADDGLVFYRRITSILDQLLSPSAFSTSAVGGESAPMVAFEVGKGQARVVEQLLVEKGLRAEVVADPWGVERAVFGYAKHR